MKNKNFVNTNFASHKESLLMRKKALVTLHDSSSRCGRTWIRCVEKKSWSLLKKVAKAGKRRTHYCDRQQWQLSYHSCAPQLWQLRKTRTRPALAVLVTILSQFFLVTVSTPVTHSCPYFLVFSVCDSVSTQK